MEPKIGHYYKDLNSNDIIKIISVINEYGDINIRIVHDPEKSWGPNLTNFNTGVSRTFFEVRSFKHLPAYGTPLYEVLNGHIE